MIVRNVICEPSGVYRDAGLFRKVRELNVQHNASWVTLKLEIEEYPQGLLSVSLNTTSVAQLAGYLEEWLATVTGQRKAVP